MSSIDGSMARRWTERVRTAGRPDAASLLERWLEAEGGWSALIAASGPRPHGSGDAGPESIVSVAAIPDVEPGAADRTQGAFVRLGGVACDAGLNLDAVREIMHALCDVVPGGPGGSGASDAVPTGRAQSGPRERLALLHGLAAGGWHAGCGFTRAIGDGLAPTSGATFEAVVSGEGAPTAAPALDPELARLIRHDIKTPLQAASLNLELLAMEQEGNPSVTGAIETIMQSLDSAVAMLQRFDNV